MTEPLLSPLADTDGPYKPSLKEVLLLDQPREVRLSPRGSRVAALVRTTNWNQNRYDNTAHLYHTDSGTRHVINRTGGVTHMGWVHERTLARYFVGLNAERKFGPTPRRSSTWIGPRSK